jgi:hypothetical protein
VDASGWGTFVVGGDTNGATVSGPVVAVAVADGPTGARLMALPIVDGRDSCKTM